MSLGRPEALSIELLGAHGGLGVFGLSFENEAVPPVSLALEIPDDGTVLTDTDSSGTDGAGKIERRERPTAKKETVLTVTIPESAYNVTATVDIGSPSLERARDIDGRVHILTQPKTVNNAFSVLIMPNEIARIVQTVRDRQPRARKIYRQKRSRLANKSVSGPLGVIVTPDNVRSAINSESSGIHRFGIVESLGLAPTQ